MSVYYYCDKNKHAGWPSFVKNLQEPSNDILVADDILFIHWSDFEDHYTEHVEFFSKKQVTKCGEIVFFSGNTTEMSDNTIIRWAEKVNIDVGQIVFKFPENVNKDVTVKFASFFNAFSNGKPPCRAHDWFDPQLGELKTAFRLLAQVWLVATEQAGEHDNEKKLKGILKKEWPILEHGFWTPVADEADEKVLKEKLRKTHRSNGEPNWESIDLTKLNAADLWEWAFSSGQ